MGKIGVAIFIIYLIVGLYLLNAPFDFVTIPKFIKGIESWVLFVGGVLVIIGGLKFLLSKRQGVAAAISPY